MRTNRESRRLRAGEDLTERVLRATGARGFGLGRRLQALWAALEREWRELFPVAWVDFYRFLQGWGPGTYDPEPFSEALVRRVLGPSLR